MKTITARPLLADRVRSLVLTLDEEEELRPGETTETFEARHIAESDQLTRILEACPLVENLQARTVHPQAGWAFLKAITAKRNIVTFIGGPRPVNPLHSWKVVTFEKPFPLVFERMKTFELDTPYGGATRPSPTLCFPALEASRMSCEIPNDTLCAFCKEAGSNLRRLYIYQEHLIPTDQIAEGLSHQFERLENLRFQLNPSIPNLELNFDRSETPLFDKLFAMTPSYQVLESLSVSATEISVSALRNLPPTLRHLEVSSFSDFSNFRPGSELDQILTDPEIDFKLQTLTVRDLVDCWGERELEAIIAQCRLRGIEFKFVPVDEDDGAYDDDFEYGSVFAPGDIYGFETTPTTEV